MEAVESRESPAAGPVLGYQAIQQRRWERGVMWLAGIVCISQLLTLPVGAIRWILFFDPVPHLSYSSPRVAIYSLSYPIISFATTVSILLLLLNRRRARTAFIACTILTILLWIFANIAEIYDDAALMRAIGQYRPIVAVHNSLTMISKAVIWCYPLMLLATVLKRPDGTQRQLSASAIWWVTVVATMLVGLATVVGWLRASEDTWEEHLTTLFALPINGDWRSTLRGIGMIAGSTACFSVFACIAWTLYRGASGRWAMMICAALWIVFAAGVYGTPFAEQLYEIRFNSWSYSSFFERVVSLFRATLSLRDLAAFMAFPLAIRVALTLSDVRARLEGTAESRERDGP